MYVLYLFFCQYSWVLWDLILLRLHHVLEMSNTHWWICDLGRFKGLLDDVIHSTMDLKMTGTWYIWINEVEQCDHALGTASCSFYFLLLLLPISCLQCHEASPSNPLAIVTFCSHQAQTHAHRLNEACEIKSQNKSHRPFSSIIWHPSTKVINTTTDYTHDWIQERPKQVCYY